MNALTELKNGPIWIEKLSVSQKRIHAWTGWVNQAHFNLAGQDKKHVCSRMGKFKKKKIIIWLEKNTVYFIVLICWRQKWELAEFLMNVILMSTDFPSSFKYNMLFISSACSCKFLLSSTCHLIQLQAHIYNFIWAFLGSRPSCHDRE